MKHTGEANSKYSNRENSNGNSLKHTFIHNEHFIHNEICSDTHFCIDLDRLIKGLIRLIAQFALTPLHRDPRFKITILHSHHHNSSGHEQDLIRWQC